MNHAPTTTNPSATAGSPNMSRFFEVLKAKGQSAISNLTSGIQAKEDERILYNLAGSKDIARMQALINGGTDPLAPTVSNLNVPGKTFAPVHRAIAEHDQAAAVLFAKSAGQANLDIQEGEYGDTPLMMSLKTGQMVLARALISLGADPSVRNKSGVSPFMEMCRLGEVALATEAVRAMDKSGKLDSMLRAEDHDGNNPLVHTTLGEGSTNDKHRLIAMFDAAGVDINGKYGPNGFTTLHHSAIHGKTEVVRFLIDDFECDVNSVSTKDELTPFMAAAACNQAESIKMLSSYPQLDANFQRPKDLSNALHLAGVRGHTEIVPSLISAGVSPKALDKDNHTPAQAARYVNQIAAARALMAFDPDSRESKAFAWMNLPVAKLKQAVTKHKL